MLRRWRTFTAKLQRLFGLIVLFCILRFVAGWAAIALFDRDAIAWGPELTIIVVASLLVYLLVALALRQVSRRGRAGT